MKTRLFNGKSDCFYPNLLCILFPLPIHQFHAQTMFNRAIDSFQLELEALASAFHDQEEEFRILQNLMQDQIIRSKSISEEEDRVMMH